MRRGDVHRPPDRLADLQADRFRITGTKLYIDLTGVVDLAGERQRLEKEIKRAAETVEFLKGKLARPEFPERAPAAPPAR